MNVKLFCVVDCVCSKVGLRDKHFHEKYKEDIKSRLIIFCNKIL